MGKLQSIQELNGLGLNTPELLLAIKQFTQAPEKKKEWDELRTKLEPGGTVSLRTARDGEYLCPHHPNISIDEANRIVQKLILDGYAIYVFGGINPSDCLMRGTISGPSDKDFFVIEWLDGPGTVRDLEKSSLVRCVEFKVLNDLKRPEFVELARMVFSRMPTIKDQIIEWSYYSTPIGSARQQFIFWEIRRWR